MTWLVAGVSFGLYLAATDQTPQVLADWIVGEH